MAQLSESERRYAETRQTLDRMLAGGQIDSDFRAEVLAQVNFFNDYAASRGLEPGLTYLVMDYRVFAAATLAEALDQAFAAGLERRPYFSEEIEALP